MLGESDAELALSWSIVRNAPLESKHGGPLCQGTRQIALSGSTRDAILDVLQVCPHTVTILHCTTSLWTLLLAIVLE